MPVLSLGASRRIALARSRYERLARTAYGDPEASTYLGWVKSTLDDLSECHNRWQLLLDQIESDLDDLVPDPPALDPDPTRN